MQIVDLQTGDALGPNEEGEILHKSEYMMTGYRGDPSSTAATFNDEGWLHTGKNHEEYHLLI